MDGREGYVPAAYVEHQPSWMSSGQTEASSDTPPALDSATTANTPLARAVASAAAAANSGGGDDGRKSPSPTGTPASHRAAYGLPADRPNLAKVGKKRVFVVFTKCPFSPSPFSQALKAHQTKAKHEVATTPNTGLQEFKRQFTQIKKKARTAVAVPLCAQPAWILF